VVRARILPLGPAAGKGQQGHDPAPNEPPATAALIVTAALRASLAGLVLSQVGAADAAGSTTAGAATAGATTAPGGSKPTVVVVHGARADSGSSDQVVARLQRQGDPVIAFPSPRRSLPDDRAELAAFRHSVPALVLVGHAYGGAVVTNAATGTEPVEALG
jgi:pimeloyl-ACP methyl ester carboxylesterase